MKNIWIYNYEEQIEKMRKLHSILKTFDGNIDEEEFSDDLPIFLKSLSKEDLEILITDIENNITSKQDALYKFYTIHSYKGLEDNYIRISNDWDKSLDDDEGENLYYVALTRGMKIIVEEFPETTQFG
jgi:superfamily I DNA/RNA helicase